MAAKTRDGDGAQELLFAKASTELQHHFKHNQKSRNLHQCLSFWDSMNHLDGGHTLVCVDGTTLTKGEFEHQYAVHPAKPALLSGLAADWPAASTGESGWTVDNLLRRYRDVEFTIAGGRIPLAHYVRYVGDSASRGASADWPFYVFEASLHGGGRERLLQEYTPPAFFDDVLEVPPCKRPAPRYFLLGPRGSGTMMHTDPCATSAWNTLLQGSKRWCLFPPSIAASELNPGLETGNTGGSTAAQATTKVVHDTDGSMGGAHMVQYVLDVKYDTEISDPDWDALSEAIARAVPGGVLFVEAKTVNIAFGLKKLQCHVVVDSERVAEESLLGGIAGEWSTELARIVQSVDIDQRAAVPDYTLPSPDCPAYWFADVYPKVRGLPGMVECIQRPGETIFVPHGWHHVVLNLEWTVAVTQNFISEATFPSAFAQLVRDDPAFAARWHRLLSRQKPHLAALVEGCLSGNSNTTVTSDKAQESSDDEWAEFEEAEN